MEGVNAGTICICTESTCSFYKVADVLVLLAEGLHESLDDQTAQVGSGQ
jgi:hypothetical protein